MSKIKAFSEIKSHGDIFRNFVQAANKVAVWFPAHCGEPCVALAFKSPDMGGIRNMGSTTTAASQAVKAAVEKWAKERLPELGEVILQAVTEAELDAAKKAAPEASAILSLALQ